VVTDIRGYPCSDLDETRTSAKPPFGAAAWRWSGHGPTSRCGRAAPTALVRGSFARFPKTPGNDGNCRDVYARRATDVVIVAEDHDATLCRFEVSSRDAGVKPLRLLRHIRSSLWFVPVVCVLAGVLLSFFVAGYWLEPVDGKGMAVIVFESEDAAGRP
jgi:hypothetical protein